MTPPQPVTHRVRSDLEVVEMIVVVEVEVEVEVEVVVKMMSLIIIAEVPAKKPTCTLQQKQQMLKSWCGCRVTWR